MFSPFRMLFGKANALNAEVQKRKSRRAGTIFF